LQVARPEAVLVAEVRKVRDLQAVLRGIAL
jgi:hypothetical protein